MITTEHVTTEAPARLRRVVGKLSRLLRQTQAGVGLTPSGISVLFTIVRDGPLRLSQLAEIEGLNPTMLSRVVANLTDAGLVERLRDPDDGRAALVAATPAGRRLRRRIHDERDDVLARELDALSAQERAALERALPVLEQLTERLRERRA